MDFKRGSEWRIWDLHVHSPASGFGTESDYPNFISNLNSSIADVIGINDYSTIEGYSKILELGGVEGKVIFPVVEFRMNNKINHKSSTATDGGVSINFHIIFDNQLTIKQINTEINSLDCFYEGGEQTKLGHAESEKLNELSFDFFKTIKALKESNILKGKFLVWVPYDEYGGIDNIDPINDAYFKLGIINKVDILGSGNKKQTDFFHSERCLNDVGKNMPCIKGSDAHQLDYPFGKLKDKESNPIEKYCWIKADLTFGGLKQIVFEPIERVKIQKENPQFDFDKPVFESIKIVSNSKVLDSENSKLEFNPIEIPLNRNLVSIIGGRGQGKSMLINYIANAFNKEIDDKLQSKLLLSEDVIVNWKQSNESTLKEFKLSQKNELPFTFIYQSKIKEIADDQVKLKEEIVEILKGAGYKKPIEKYDELVIKEKFQNYWNLKDWLNKKDEDGNQINDIGASNKKIDSVKENIALATDRDSKDLLDKYILNLSNIEISKAKISKLNKLKIRLEEFQQETNPLLTELSITIINFKTQLDEIEKSINIENNKTEALTLENSQIRENNFKDFKGDLTQLLNNLENYRNEIVRIEGHIENIKAKETELSIIKRELNEVIKSFYEALLLEAKSINDTWEKNIFDNPNRGEKENLLIRNILDKRDIKIESEIFFNVNQFLVNAGKYIDGRVVKSKFEKIKEILELGDSMTQSVLDFTIDKVERIRKDNESVFWDGIENDIANVFLDKQIRDKYIQVRPKITIKGDELDDLSAGQKGTIYLCLKLATQTFSGPLVFDQPEDDLDNEFINEELIQLFSEIKEFRQVIIVSHNANLVVNSDSEQIIIAKNELGGLTYESGSLENDLINNGICRILEGGSIAFEKRRNKYNNVN